MRFNLTVEFDSLQDYVDFSLALERQFGKKRMPPKGQPILNNPKVETIAPPKPDPVSKLDLLGFRPTPEMQRKIRQYLQAGQSFKTQDIIGPTLMANPNRRAGANRWLQSHSELRWAHQSEPGKGGRGPLVYSPIHKVVLPPGKQPRKTDWPVKGAALKKTYIPTSELQDEPDLYGIPSLR
jgi:hypothetical protein